MAWGKSGSNERPAWLGSLQRDDATLVELAVLRPLDRSMWLELCAALGKSTQLKRLSAHKSLDEEVLGKMADAVASSRLEKVSVGTSALGDAGVALLLPGLAACATLTACDLERRGLTAAGARAVAEQLVARSPSLRSLAVGRNEFGSEGVQVLAHAVAASRLTELDISHTSGIEPASAAALARACHPPSALSALVMRGAPLGAEGATAFASALLSASASCTLASVVLADASLGSDDSAAALLTALAGACAHLATVDVESANIGPGACDAVGALAARQPLRVLRLGRNALGDDGIGRLARALDGRAAALEELHLGCVGLEGADALGALLRALRPCAALRTLELMGNPLGDAGVRALVEEAAAAHAGGLGAVDALGLAGCAIGIEGARTIAGALCARGVLPRLAALECAKNPACEHADWEASVVRPLSEARPTTIVVWRAHGSEAAP